MTEYFALVAQLAATLLVAYVILVGPRRNADLSARVMEIIGSVLMGLVLMIGVGGAMPEGSPVQLEVALPWTYLALFTSVVLLITSAFTRPPEGWRPFWFRPSRREPPTANEFDTYWNEPARRFPGRSRYARSHHRVRRTFRPAREAKGSGWVVRRVLRRMEEREKARIELNKIARTRR